MAKRLSFSWALDERVGSMEGITENKINAQVEKLNNMLNELKVKLENELHNVYVDNACIVNCNGCYESRNNNIKVYSINNRMNIIISKKGRKSTWNDVYKVVNSIKSAKYDFI